MANERIDLVWLVSQGEDEINNYLGDVHSSDFIADVMELAKKRVDKQYIEQTIKKLQMLL